MDPSLLLTPPHRRAFLRPFAWRGLAFALVTAAGVTALLMGVEVSERDLTGTGLPGKLYYVLGLFVLMPDGLHGAVGFLTSHLTSTPRGDGQSGLIGLQHQELSFHPGKA